MVSIFNWGLPSTWIHILRFGIQDLLYPLLDLPEPRLLLKNLWCDFRTRYFFKVILNFEDEALSVAVVLLFGN